MGCPPWPTPILLRARANDLGQFPARRRADGPGPPSGAAALAAFGPHCLRSHRAAPGGRATRLAGQPARIRRVGTGGPRTSNRSPSALHSNCRGSASAARPTCWATASAASSRSSWPSGTAQLFDRLVLVDTGAAIPPQGQGAFHAMAERVESGGMEAVLATALQRMFPDDFLAAHTAIAEERKASLRAARPEYFAAACRALAKFDRRAQLGTIRNPTLVVVGLRDTATPPALSYELAAGIPGADAGRTATVRALAAHPGSRRILAGDQALPRSRRIAAPRCPAGSSPRCTAIGCDG